MDVAWWPSSCWSRTRAEAQSLKLPGALGTLKWTSPVSCIRKCSDKENSAEECFPLCSWVALEIVKVYIKAQFFFAQDGFEEASPESHLTFSCLVCEVYPAGIWCCHTSGKHLLCAVTWGRGGAQVWRPCSGTWLKLENQVPKLLRK